MLAFSHVAYIYTRGRGPHRHMPAHIYTHHHKHTHTHTKHERNVLNASEHTHGQIVTSSKNITVKQREGKLISDNITTRVRV